MNEVSNARTMVAHADGDSAAELESIAMTLAESFFGDGIKLRMKNGYSAYPVTNSEQHHGKAYTAIINIEEVLDPVKPPAGCEDQCKCRPVQVNITHIHKN